MDALTSLLRFAPNEVSFNPLGLIVMLLGALLALPASAWARGNERRETILRLSGLLLAALGTLITLQIFR